MANALWVAPSVNDQWAPSSRTNDSYYRKLITSRPSLVGFWRGDPVTGTSDLDQSLGANVSTLSVVTLNQPQILVDQDFASSFNGTTSIASVADATNIHVGDVFTITLWIRRSAVGLGGNANLITGSTNSPSIQINSSDLIICNKRAGGTLFASSVAITDTTILHHIAWAKNGVNNHLFLDGVDVTGAITNQTMSNTAVGYTIGAQAGPNTLFPGIIASVALYSAELTPAQMIAEFRVGRGGTGIMGVAA